MLSLLDTAYNRLDEAHRAWHMALAGYHRIDDFRAGINTAIQSLRNITFTLQSQKDGLPNFDTWYSNWQIKIKTDPVLKEFNTARTAIVHQEDLKLHSTAIARTKGWIDFQKMAFTFDPTKDSHDVAKGFYDAYVVHLPIAEEMKYRLVFEFERKWVYDKLPDYELLDAVGYACNFFFEMLRDAEREFFIPARKDIRTGDYCESRLNNIGQLKCMVITPQERCLSFGFKDGNILRLQTDKISHSEKDMIRAHKRYGDWNSEDIVSMLIGIFPDEYPFEQMKIFVQAALCNLKKDGHLIPTSFLFKNSGDSPMIIAHPFINQEAKVMAIDRIASEIIKNDVSFVLVLSEAWQYDETRERPPTEDDTKYTKDLFQASCVSADKIKIITIPFHKNVFRKVIFSKTQVQDFLTTEKHHQYILLPLIEALRKAKDR